MHVCSGNYGTVEGILLVGGHRTVYIYILV